MSGFGKKNLMEIDGLPHQRFAPGYTSTDGDAALARGRWAADS